MLHMYTNDANNLYSVVAAQQGPVVTQVLTEPKGPCKITFRVLSLSLTHTHSHTLALTHERTHARTHARTQRRTHAHTHTSSNCNTDRCEGELATTSEQKFLCCRDYTLGQVDRDYIQCRVSAFTDLFVFGWFSLFVTHLLPNVSP